MLYGRKKQTIPSDTEYPPDLVHVLLRQVSEVTGRRITRREWEQLGQKKRRGMREI
ncbi:MAG TPA: hypothetical protein VFA78_03325 [Chloroflexota bacterium]|nr:hypothetical protein [Chloroflexota bacterium]